MRLQKLVLGFVALLIAGALVGCSNTPKSPDVRATIRKSLDQAGLRDVTVSQDQTKGVITLGGHVASDADKSQAQSIAQSAAAGQVVANQIEVNPPNAGNQPNTVNSDLDAGIKKNVDAALVQHRLNKGVTVDVKNGVVTLKGHTYSEAASSRVQQLVSSVPNVTQVVNELEVKGRKASSTRARSTD